MAMDTETSYTQLIKRHCPDLRVETVSFNQRGQYNDVLIVNETLIFRFAKVLPALETLRQEILILQSLQDHISLAIPDPIYHNVDAEIGEAFVGYRMIPGNPLWREDFRAISDATAHRRMAVQLSGFLQELHRVSAREVIPLELPLADSRGEWVEMFQRFREKLFAYMRPDARRQVTAHFEAFLDNPDLYRFKPVLRHGDFGTGNIIYDPQRLSIVGIIDFAGIGLGDPAVDFAGLYSSYGRAFYEHGYSVYPEMEQALPRVRFYCGTFALQEALFGTENGDKAAFQRGIATYV